MLYREMPKTGDRLSILGFGCMRLPGGMMNPDEKESITQIRYAIDNGINYLDTAWPYHEETSEILVGKALQNGYRERVKIATKLPSRLIHDTRDMDMFLNRQLKKLQTEQIDFYLLHGLSGMYNERARRCILNNLCHGLQLLRNISG